MIPNPCYRCEKRRERCAVGCPEWADYLEEKAWERKMRDAERMTTGYAVEQLIKKKKRLRK